jgi:hypothetical protein
MAAAMNDSDISEAKTRKKFIDKALGSKRGVRLAYCISHQNRNRLGAVVRSWLGCRILDT